MGGISKPSLVTEGAFCILLSVNILEKDVNPFLLFSTRHR